MSKIICSLVNGTIRYPDQTMFSNVFFEVKRGEHWLLVGRNASLKSAILDAIAGRVNVLNFGIRYPLLETHVQELASDIAFHSPGMLIASVSYKHHFRNLSNTTDFYYQQRFNSIDSENSLTVKQYLQSIKHYGQNQFWTFSKTVEKLHLHNLLDEHLIKLSNGETKRVLLAAAILRNPMLLLLDNPLTGLDVQTRREVKQLIDVIASSGITIVMAGNTSEIPECITHVAEIRENNNIEKFLKENYRSNPLSSTADAQVDVDELKLLLQLPLNNYSDIVAMKDVTIRYGDKTILNKINWTVKQGEKWALTGPNGSGKSTLLSLINGDNPQAFANDIILFDRKKGSGESIWDIKKNIGFFSPELYQYFPGTTTCLQTVECGFYDTIGLFRPSFRSTSSIALRWMKIFKVDHLAGKLLKNIAPVEQRLCLLARAMVKNPPLLILDEPTQGFDDLQQEYFKKIIDIICSIEKVTLIYVSHYAEDIPLSVDRIIKLRDGKRVE